MTSMNFKNQFSVFCTSVCLLLVVAFTSCSDDDQVAVEPTPDRPMAISDQVVNIPFFVETESRELPSNPNDLLYENRKHNPVLAPDGHQLTWAEFSAVRGDIMVECTDAGTYASLRLTGLIPNGVYTVWNVTVQEPGFDPAAEMFNINGIGAAGKGDGSDNVFTADAQGTTEISLTSPGGNLSMFGEIRHCALTEQFEWHVVGSYHLDGNTYGPDLGPDGTVAEQFGFIFRKDI